MKKANILLFFVLLVISFRGFSQTPAKDFFAGKWQIALSGTPNGDVTFMTDLIRQDGKLTGELVNQTDLANSKRKITKVEENGDKLAIYFESSQGGEISIDLTKVDNDNLKGNLMNFDAKAKRLK